MVYYRKNTNEEFEKGDKVYLVNCGNPNHEIEDGKTVVAAGKKSTKQISASPFKIEEVVTEDGELQDRFK